MPRPLGRRNADFEARRTALAKAASSALLAEDGLPSSMSALAVAAGVSVPTLKHYFGDHDGVVAAALEAAEEASAPHLQRARDPGDLPLAESMADVAEGLVTGWGFGLGDLFAGALTHGLRHDVRGRATVDHVLEPTIQAVEERLAEHERRGELRAGTDHRTAALGFLSPLLLALLHQNELSGRACRPLDVDAYVAEHIAAWVRAWGTGTGRSQS